MKNTLDKSKTSEELYLESFKDFVEKFPELKKHDFVIRFGQALVQFSDVKENHKETIHLLANAFVKALDESNK